jgi:hypothetical protein
MTSGQTKKMTALYVKETGHVLAVLTRTDATGGVPTIADFAGVGLFVRGIPAQSTSPWTGAPGTFLIPTEDLASGDFDIDTNTAAALNNPREFGVVTSSGGPASQPTLSSLQSSPLPGCSVSFGLFTLNFNGAPTNLHYYAMIVSTVSQPDPPPVVQKFLHGPIPAAGSLTIPAATLSQPYSVLILVETLLPVLVSFP